MGPFENLRAGNVVEFKKYLDETLASTLSITTTPPFNLSLLDVAVVAVTSKDSSKEHKQCFELLVKKLGNGPVTTDWDKKEINKSDPLLYAVKTGQHSMVMILLPYYLQAPIKLDEFWGAGKTEKIKASIHAAIAAITTSTPNYEKILNNFRSQVTPNTNNNNLSPSYLGLLAEFQTPVNKKISDLMPNDIQMLKTSTGSPVLDSLKMEDTYPSTSGAATSSSSSSSSSSTAASAIPKVSITGGNKSDVRFTAIYEAKNNLANAFLSPATTEEDFKRELDNLATALKNSHLHHSVHLEKIDADKELSNELRSIKLTPFDLSIFEPQVSLLTCACMYGLRSVKNDEVINYLGVNEAVFFAFEKKLHEDDKIAALQEIVARKVPLHATMQDYVKTTLESAAHKAKASEKQTQSVDVVASNNHSSEILPAVASHSSLEDIVDAIRLSLQAKNILAFTANILVLREHSQKNTSDTSMAEANLAAALNSITMSGKSGEKADTLLQHAIHMPEGEKFVRVLLTHLGPEISTGDIEEDPLVMASREARPEMVALLLPHYEKRNEYWGEKSEKISNCVKVAIEQIGGRAGSSSDDAFKKDEVRQKFQSRPGIADQHEMELSNKLTLHAGEIEQCLKKEIDKDFKKGDADWSEFKAKIERLERFYLRRAQAAKTPEADVEKTLWDSIHRLGLLEYGAEKGFYDASDASKNPEGVNRNIFENLLITLLKNGKYISAGERQVLFGVAVMHSQPEVQRSLLRYFGKFRLESDSSSVHHVTTGLDLVRKQINELIIDIVTDGHASADEFDNALLDLRAELKKQESGLDGAELDAQVAEALLDLEVKDGGSTKSLFQYACDKGIYSEANKEGVNDAVFMKFRLKLTNQQIVNALPGNQFDNVHHSIQPYLPTHTDLTLAVKPAPSTYKSSAITGAKWMAALTTLAIIGVLADAFLFGEDSNMEKKLYSLANWCWRKPFDNSSNLDVNSHCDSHEAEMLSCVGAVMILGAAVIGGVAGAGVHKATKPKMH
ncbi:MAG: hypothetical protein ACHQAX_04010 [Gammaproteobacteria bacterium]